MRTKLLRWVFVMVGAAGFGWWARGTHEVRVLAQGNEGNRNFGADGLAFQLGGVSPETALTVWNPNNRNLYIYTGALMGNSQVNCAYSLHIERAGAPIQRQNCPIGSIGSSR